MLHDKSAVRRERSLKVKRSCRAVPGHHSVSGREKLHWYLNFSLSNQLKLSSCERNKGSGVKLRRPQMSNELSPAVTVTLAHLFFCFFGGWTGVEGGEGGAWVSDQQGGETRRGNKKKLGGRRTGPGTAGGMST